MTITIVILTSGSWSHSWWKQVLNPLANLNLRQFVASDVGTFTPQQRQFKAVDDVITEYFELSHAESAPVADHDKPREWVYYLPVHTVIKKSSFTTKIHTVLTRFGYFPQWSVVSWTHCALVPGRCVDSFPLSQKSSDYGCEQTVSGHCTSS